MSLQQIPLLKPFELIILIDQKLHSINQLPYMQSARTYKQSLSSFVQGQSISLPMQLENILLKLFKSAENILPEDCLESLTQIVEQAATTETNCIKCIQSAFFLLLSHIGTLQQKTSITIQQNDYEVLEKTLQKAESQVRKHIRIEQQLKLYLDGLQEKNQNLQKQLKLQQTKYLHLFQSVKIMDHEKKQLQRNLKKSEERYKFYLQKEKIKNHKSAKVISESFSRAQNHSVSVYKSRPTLANHQYSKSKISDKSSQKDKKELRIGFEKKNQQKLKQLDGMIEVNLYNDPHKQSRDMSNANDETFIPTEEDVRIFREMTKTVQMKEAYKRPVRKVTKYKTEGKEGKDHKQSKQQNQSDVFQNRQYRSVSMYK